MPFTRISLLAGKPAYYLTHVAESLELALVESFEVPPDDRFVVFHQHQPGELIFDRHYGGGPRSDDYVLFHITTGRARSPETKALFYRRLTDELAAAPGIRPEDVMIVITDSTLADWSFAAGVAASSGQATAR